MLDITIPGYRQLQLHHLVLDFNGTLACDGSLCVGVRGRLNDLGKQLQIHVVTADTFGKARAALEGIQCEILVLESAHAGRLIALGLRRDVEAAADLAQCALRGPRDVVEKSTIAAHREDYGILVSEIHRVPRLWRTATGQTERGFRDAFGRGRHRMGKVQEMPPHLCSLYR